MVELLGRYSKNDGTLDRLCRLEEVLKSSAVRPAESGPGHHVHKLAQRLGEELLDQVVADYIAGASSYELADIYGVSKTAILRLMRARGVVRRPGATSEQSRQRE